MKRKYYRIHHYNYAQPLRRVKRRTIVWPRLMLSCLVIVLLAVGTVAIIKWVNDGKTRKDALANHDALMSTYLPGTTVAATETPKPTVEATMPPNLAVDPIEGISPEDKGFSTKIMYDGNEIPSWQNNSAMSFGSGDEYSDVEGITTFGKNNYRNNFTYGTQNITEERMTEVWNVPVGSLYTSEYSGTGIGWTGQPLIIKWDDATRAVLGVYEKFKNDPEFTEVIYPAMDGNIYFIDLNSGEQSRPPINIGVITKGTAALDPRGYPLLYTGQGITSTEDGYTGTWVRVINLISNEVVYKFGGRDPFSPRSWQAYDSSPLICADADTLIFPGENGCIYFVKLNTQYDAATGTLSIDPSPLLKFKYVVDSGYSPVDAEGYSWYGFESSAACWRNYLFITDNGGHLLCINIGTLELEYVLDVTDDSDVTMVLEEDPIDGTVYLYTANEVDKQPIQSGNVGISYHRKFNALTGQLIWEKTAEAYVGSSSSNGGTLASPHVGRGEISNLVIYSMTLAKVTYTDESGNTVTGGGGLMIAYDKRTGEEVWRHEQEWGYWSTPVVVYAESGIAYVIQGDRDGIVSMHRARDGKVISTLNIGSRIESTPAIFNNMMVVGTRGSGGDERAAGIFGIRLG